MLQERENLLTQISANTLRFRIKQWVENFAENLPYIHGGRGVAGLANMMAGLPAAIIGSGPTLDRNIKDIRLLKNKALIIACDSAAKALEAFDAHADIIMVTDSKERVADFLRDLDLERYSVVADTFIHPKTTEVLQRAKRLYWYSTLPIDSCPFTGALNDWTGFIGNLGTGGCVATTAWWMAARLIQADPTILIGLPEAFYDPAQMYSNEVNKTVETEPYDSHLVETFDIFGKQCYTFPALQSFAWWFQDAFLNVPGLHINCSEGGILQENCLNMPLLACIQKYLNIEFDVEEVLYSKEYIIDTMFQEGGERVASLKKHRNLMEIIIDSPSLTNLGLRMGKNERTFGEIVDIIDELRAAGFVIEENESQITQPDGSHGRVARVFSLKGLQLPADDDNLELQMTIEIVDGRPMLVKTQELDLPPAEREIIDIMNRGLPPLTASQLAGLLGLEENLTDIALVALIAKELVVKHIAEPGSDPVYNIANPNTPPAATLCDISEEPFTDADIHTNKDRYGELATNPNIASEAMNRLAQKWLPKPPQDTERSPQTTEDGPKQVS